MVYSFMPRPIALITGATAGIGRATAAKLAKENFNLIVTGRRGKLLEQLAEELTRQCRVEIWPLRFDISKRAAVDAAFKSLPSAWRPIAVLVNNAGLALGREPIQEGNVDDWETMIDTNLKGLLYVTRLVLPQMVTANAGHIINLGSIAGKEVYPSGNVYSMTKHAVVALSKAMRLDLVAHNIKVTVINPGYVRTEFASVRYRGDQQKITAAYEGFQTLAPEDVAEAVYFALSRPAHVNIDEILLTPAAQASVVHIHRATA